MMIGGNERINFLNEALRNHCALIDVLNQDSATDGILSALSVTERKALIEVVDKMETRVSFYNRSTNARFDGVSGWIGISTTPTGIELTDEVAYLEGRNDVEYLKGMYSALFLNKEMLSPFFTFTSKAGKITLTPKKSFPLINYRFPTRPEDKLWFHHIVEGTRLEAAMKADDQIGWLLRLLTIGNFCEPMGCTGDRNLAYLRIYQAFGIDLESAISPYRTNDERDSVFGFMPKEPNDVVVTYDKIMTEVNGYNDYDRGFYLNGLAGSTIHLATALNIFKQGRQDRTNFYSPPTYTIPLSIPYVSFTELFRNKTEWENGTNRNILKDYGNLVYALSPPGFRSNLNRTASWGEERALSERMDRVLSGNATYTSWHVPGTNPLLGINTTAPEWLVIEQDLLTGYITLRNQHPNKYVYFTVGGLDLPVPPKQVCVINPESFNQYILVKEFADRPKGYRTGFDLMYKERWKLPSGDDSVGYSDTCYFPPINVMPIRPDREPDTYKLRARYGFGGMGCNNFMINVDNATKAIKNASVRWLGTPISAFFRKSEVMADFLLTSYLAREIDPDLKLDLNLIKGLLLPSNARDDTLKGKFVYYMRRLAEAIEDRQHSFEGSYGPLWIAHETYANAMMSFSLLPSSVYLPEGVHRIASGHSERNLFQSMPGFIYWSEKTFNPNEWLKTKLNVRNGHWLEIHDFGTTRTDTPRKAFHENITKENLMSSVTFINHDEIRKDEDANKGIVNTVPAINLDIDNILNADEPIRFSFKTPVVYQSGYVRQFNGSFTIDEFNAFGGIDGEQYRGISGQYFLKNNVGKVAGTGVATRLHGHLTGSFLTTNWFKRGPIHPGMLGSIFQKRMRYLDNVSGISMNNTNQIFHTDYFSDTDELNYGRDRWRFGYGSSAWWFAIDYFASETTSMRPNVKTLTRSDLINYNMPSTTRDFVWFKPSSSEVLANNWAWTGYGQMNLVSSGYLSHRSNSSGRHNWMKRWWWSDRYPGCETVYPAFVKVNEMDTHDRYGKLLKYKSPNNFDAANYTQTYWNPIISTSFYDFIIPCDGSIVTNYTTTAGEMGSMTHANPDEEEYGDYFVVETGRETASLSFIHVRENSMELYQFPYGVSSVHIVRSYGELRILNDFSTSYQGWVEREPYIKRTIREDSPLETSTYWFVKVLIAANFAIGLDRLSVHSGYFKRFVAQTGYSQYLHPGLEFHEVKGDRHQRERNSANPPQVIVVPNELPDTSIYSTITNEDRGMPQQAFGRQMNDLEGRQPYRKWLIPQVLDDRYSGILFRGAGYEHYQNNRIYYKDLFGTSQSVQYFKLLGKSYIRMVGRIPPRRDEVTGREELLQKPVIFELKGEAEVWYWGVGGYYSRLSKVKIKDGFRWTNNAHFAYHLTGADDMNFVDNIDKENCIGVNGGKWEMIKIDHNVNTPPYYQYDERVLGSKEDANSVYFNQAGYLFLKDTEALWGEQKRPKPARPTKNVKTDLNNTDVFYFRTNGKIKRCYGDGQIEAVNKTRNDFIRELPLLDRLYSPSYGEVIEHCAYVPVVFKNGSLSLSVPWVNCNHGDEKVMSYSGSLKHFYGKHYTDERKGTLVLPAKVNDFAGEKRDVTNAVTHSRFTPDGYFKGALHRVERSWFFFYSPNQMDTWAKGSDGKGDDSSVFFFNNYRAKCVNDFNVKDFKLQIEPFFKDDRLMFSLFKVNVFEGVTYISVRKPIYIRLDMSRNHADITLFNIQGYKGKVIINLEAPIYIETINPKNYQLTVYSCNLVSYTNPQETVVEFLNYSPEKLIVSNGNGRIFREKFSTNRNTYNF